jgi:hypothetical protein
MNCGGACHTQRLLAPNAVRPYSSLRPYGGRTGPQTPTVGKCEGRKSYANGMRAWRRWWKELKSRGGRVWLREVAKAGRASEKLLSFQLVSGRLAEFVTPTMR